MTASSGRARPSKATVSAGSAGASGPGSPLDHASLLEALRTLLQPLAALSVARGMPFATVEEMMKTSFVEAARTAHSNMAGQRMVSRISTVTGLNRREVSRLMQTESSAAPPRVSPATQVFTRWVAEPSLKTAKGEPMPLPRQGPAPSFEELARSVTRDVHPRSLLDELCRLGLARVDGETVHVVRESFVPRGDSDRMLGFLGSNVGDHLRAAVSNVLSDSPKNLEQAVFADELSQTSLDDLQQVVRAQWQALLTATVPVLHRLIDADRAAKRVQDQRVRIGLYVFSDAMSEPTVASDSKAPTPTRKSAPKSGKGK
jgi:hypothetical protein